MELTLSEYCHSNFDIDDTFLALWTIDTALISFHHKIGTRAYQSADLANHFNYYVQNYMKDARTLFFLEAGVHFFYVMDKNCTYRINGNTMCIFSPIGDRRRYFSWVPDIIKKAIPQILNPRAYSLLGLNINYQKNRKRLKEK